MDTTQRHAPPAASELRLAESRLAMVWTARPDLSCDYVSPAWLEYTGASAEQALGEGWSQGVHPEDLARWLDTSVQAFDARQPYELDYRLRRHDGEYRWVLERARPRFSAHGVFLGYIGICIDIHERKRAEDELARSLERERRLRCSVEEASRAKTAFLFALLEELQTPVRAIQTWAAHLRSHLSATSEAAGALESIERNAGAQARLLGSLLELTASHGPAASASLLKARLSSQDPLLGGVRVLLLDGNSRTRDTILRVLRVAGAETRSVASASEAIDALGAWRPDVLLSDCERSAAEGYVLIRALRSLPAERGGCLRAAALTARTPEAPAMRAMAAGYDAELAKPVEPVTLLATVARLAHV